MSKVLLTRFLKKHPTLKYLARLINRLRRNFYKKLTIHKRISEILSEVENQALPQKMGRPTGTLIEITNACNLNCVMCNTKLSKRPIGIMELSIFEKILQQLITVGINTVGLHTVGETFMHTKLESLLEIIERYKFNVWLSTNAQFPQRIEPLYRKFPNLVNRFRFSIDGATKDTYESIRRGGKLEKVIESMEVIHKLNKGRKNSRIHLSVDSILSTSNVYEIPVFFKKYGKYCWPEDITFNLVDGLSPDPDYFRSSFPYPNLIRQNIPCNMPFENVYFTYGGKVTLCCRDYEEELVVGDIEKESLIHIWDGTEAEIVREKHLAPEKMDIQACKACFGPYAFASSVMNEYIHFFYARFPNLEASKFGDKILYLLHEMNSAMGNKNLEALKKCVREAFVQL